MGAYRFADGMLCCMLCVLVLAIPTVVARGAPADSAAQAFPRGVGPIIADIKHRQDSVGAASGGEDMLRRLEAAGVATLKDDLAAQWEHDDITQASPAPVDAVTYVAVCGRRLPVPMSASACWLGLMLAVARGIFVAAPWVGVRRRLAFGANCWFAAPPSATGWRVRPACRLRGRVWPSEYVYVYTWAKGVIRVEVPGSMAVCGGLPKRF